MRKGTVCPPRVAVNVAYYHDLLLLQRDSNDIVRGRVTFSKGTNKIERVKGKFWKGKSRILKIYL